MDNTEYVSTEILECNNLSSVQRLGGNTKSNAIFTNRLGKNLNLKRGDRISIEQAFINERGCGVPNAIELEGNNLNKIKSYYYTDTKSYGFQSYETNWKMDRAKYQTSILTEKKKELKDNEINIETNFYCNTNGEGYYFLPRRFATAGNVRMTLASGQATNQFLRNIESTTKQYWTNPDSITEGRCYYERGLLTDLYSTCLNDMLFFTDNNKQNPDGETGYYKPRSDGGRLTIMVRDKWIQDVNFTLDGTDVAKDYWDSIPLKRDPALHGEYHLYQDLLEITLPIGYNSPQNIAETITEQLQKAREPEIYYVEDNGDPHSIQEWTTLYSTDTYKPFNCANKKNNDKTAYDYFADNTSTEVFAFNHDASYQYIGVKRPDLFKYGREFHKKDPAEARSKLFEYHLTEAITNTAVGRKVEVKTNIPYNKDTLTALNNLFKAQGTYPELFYGNELHFGAEDDPEVHIGNARFLHINRYNDDTHGNDDILGNDNYTDLGQNMTSMPFFFYYDPAYADKETEATRTDALSYGFATKWIGAGDKEYITLHPELFVNGIRPYVFEFDDIDAGYKRQIGWDWHFNAYSTIACQLYSGYLDYTYDDTFNFGLASLSTKLDAHNQNRYKTPTNIGELVSKIYLGANNCSMIYDENGHFALTQLHTAENVGQPYNAGDVPSTNPILDNAGDECYKINKKLEIWSWTPEMKPYKFGEKAYGVVVGPLKKVVGDHPVDLKQGEIWFDSGIANRNEWTVVETGGVGTKGIIDWGAVEYEPNNPALDPYSIIDSQTGIILNLGNSFDEDNFYDGLIGIMGFSWEQFNPSIINEDNNITARISTLNDSNLKYVTTNSELVETETKNFVVNRYGAVMYTTQVPTPMMLEGWVNKKQGNMTDGAEHDPEAVGGGEADRLSAYSLYPVIVEKTTSINIRASRLPRRMIRPYYCIRSDLILSTPNTYIGGKDGNAVLPIISLVNKENGFGDYFFSMGNGTQFTITKDNSVCEITTSITNPDQSLANVDDGCCIIYKIERPRVLDNSIIQELLEASQPRKKKTK